MVIEIALGIVLGVVILIGLALLIPWVSRNRDDVGEWLAIIVGIIFIYLLFAHTELVKAIFEDFYGR